MVTLLPGIRKTIEAPVISLEEEQHLIAEYKNHDDIKARNKLVQAYIRMALYSATRGNYKEFVQDDIFQEAVMGLMQTVNKFKPDEGVRFFTYAKYWVDAYVNKYNRLNYSIPLPQNFHVQLRIIKKQHSKLIKQGLSNLEAYDVIAKLLRCSITDLDAFKPYVDSENIVSTLEGVKEEPLVDSPKTNGQSADILIQNMIKKAIKTLSPKQQSVINQRYFEEPRKKLKEVSKTMCTSVQNINQIEVRALRDMKTYLCQQCEKEGVSVEDALLMLQE